MRATVPCRECAQTVPSDASRCENCGAPRPGDPGWKGEGYEWKSRGTWLGYPLVHVAFGSDCRGRARMARGVVAIGQRARGGLALGIVSVGLLSVGVVSCGIFSIGIVSIALGCAVGINAIAPVAIGISAFGYIAKGIAVVGWKSIP